VQEAIWSPSTWLHAKQMIDDFVLYTVFQEICTSNGVEFIFNVRQCFRNFMAESMPSLDALTDGKAKEKTKAGSEAENAYKELITTLSSQSQMSQEQKKQTYKKLPRGLIFDP